MRVSIRPASVFAFSVCAICLLLGAGYATATPAVDARVLYAGRYGDGTMFIYFDHSLDEPGCAAPEIRVHKDNPYLKNWLAIAMTAATSGTTARVQTDSCFMERPTLSTIGSYLFLWAPQ